MNTNGITHLSFDCYGTLIDWENGILDQAEPRLADAGASNVDPVKLLRGYVKHEAALEAGPFQPYRDALAQTFFRVAADLGVPLAHASCAAFAEGRGGWPAFPATVHAL